MGGRTAKGPGRHPGGGEGPTIFTERDLLHATGTDNDPDSTLVAEHLTQRLIYADADWSLERAAERMASGAFRHVVVLDASEVVGILSMRDIVRCWTEQQVSLHTG